MPLPPLIIDSQVKVAPPGCAGETGKPGWPPNVAAVPISGIEDALTQLARNADATKDDFIVVNNKLQPWREKAWFRVKKKLRFQEIQTENIIGGFELG